MKSIPKDGPYNVLYAKLSSFDYVTWRLCPQQVRLFQYSTPAITLLSDSNRLLLLAKIGIGDTVLLCILVLLVLMAARVLPCRRRLQGAAKQQRPTAELEHTVLSHRSKLESKEQERCNTAQDG